MIPNNFTPQQTPSPPQLDVHSPNRLHTRRTDNDSIRQRADLSGLLGLSNFKPAHIDRLLTESTIRPAVNQIQLNPRITRPEQRSYNSSQGIVTEAWSPLGAGNELLENPTLEAIAARHGKTPAQVVLRWHIELGIVAIPRSANPGRIAQNIHIFDFMLTSAEIAAISALDTGEEPRVDSETVGH